MSWKPPRALGLSLASLVLTAVACTSTHDGTLAPASTNGRIVALVKRDSGFPVGDLYSFEPDGSGLQRLTRTGDLTVQFAFSPDGSSLAFAQSQGMSTWNIGVMNADGTGRRLLTDSPPVPIGSPTYFSPSWLPDGAAIRYFRNDGNGPALGKGEGLWLVKPDGSDAHHSDLNWDPFEVVWSPDGSRFAWDGDDGLYVANADGTDHIQITSSFHDFAPAWSPDASRLAFARDGSVLVVNADGTGERTLWSCSAPCGADFPTWSPDGTKIAFTAASATGSRVEIMNPDGSDVVSVPGLPQGLVSLAWQPIPSSPS